VNASVAGGGGGGGGGAPPVEDDDDDEDDDEDDVGAAAGVPPLVSAVAGAAGGVDGSVGVESMDPPGCMRPVVSSPGSAPSPHAMSSVPTATRSKCFMPSVEQHQCR
jgi:hypothetical protein